MLSDLITLPTLKLFSLLLTNSFGNADCPRLHSTFVIKHWLRGTQGERIYFVLQTTVHHGRAGLGLKQKQKLWRSAAYSLASPRLVWRFPLPHDPTLDLLAKKRTSIDRSTGWFLLSILKH